MNRRIKKKKLKQRLTQEEAIEQLSIKRKAHGSLPKQSFAIVNAATGERRNYSNRLHKHWLHDTRTHWKIHVPHAYN